MEYHYKRNITMVVSFDMVLRYAHLNSDPLKSAAERVAGAKLVPIV